MKLDPHTPTTRLDFWRPPGLERWPWLEALVTTRHGGTSPEPYASLNLGLSSGDATGHVLANRDLLCRTLGLPANRLHHLRQVHGTQIWDVPGCTAAQGDGLFTTEVGPVLVVGVADCVPVFVWDARQRHIAMVHAGWRGSAAGILEHALHRFRMRGSRREDLWVALGPSIGPCCYEVSRETAANFPPEVLRDAGDRLQLDLRAANRLQSQISRAVRLSAGPKKSPPVSRQDATNDLWTAATRHRSPSPKTRNTFTRWAAGFRVCWISIGSTLWKALTSSGESRISP